MHRPVLDKIGVAYSSATTSLAARSGWTGQQPLSQVCNTGLFTWPVVAWTSGAAPHPSGHMHSTHAMPTCSHLACQGRSILQGGGVSSVPASCKAALPRQKKLSPTATASDSSGTSRHCTLPPSMAWPCHGLHASVAHPGGSVGHGGHARSPPRVLWGPSAVGPVVIAVTAAGTGMNCDHTPLPQTLAPRHVCGLSVLLGGSPSTGLGHYKPTNPCPRPSLALP